MNSLEIRLVFTASVGLQNPTESMLENINPQQYPNDTATQIGYAQRLNRRNRCY